MVCSTFAKVSPELIALKREQKIPPAAFELYKLILSDVAGQIGREVTIDLEEKAALLGLKPGWLLACLKRYLIPKGWVCEVYRRWKQPIFKLKPLDPLSENCDFCLKNLDKNQRKEASNPDSDVPSLKSLKDQTEGSFPEKQRVQGGGLISLAQTLPSPKLKPKLRGEQAEQSSQAEIEILLPKALEFAPGFPQRSLVEPLIKWGFPRLLVAIEAAWEYRTRVEARGEVVAEPVAVLTAALQHGWTPNQSQPEARSQGLQPWEAELSEELRQADTTPPELPAPTAAVEQTSDATTKPPEPEEQDCDSLRRELAAIAKELAIQEGDCSQPNQIREKLNDLAFKSFGELTLRKLNLSQLRGLRDLLRRKIRPKKLTQVFFGAPPELPAPTAAAVAQAIAPFTHPEPAPGAEAAGEHPADLSEFVSRSQVEIKRLGWDDQRVSEELRSRFKVVSTGLLSDSELIKWVRFLQGCV